MDWNEILQKTRKNGLTAGLVSLVAVLVPTVLTISTEAISSTIQSWSAGCRIVIDSRRHSMGDASGSTEGRIYRVRTQGATPDHAELTIGTQTRMTEATPLIYRVEIIDDPDRAYSLRHPYLGERCEGGRESANGVDIDRFDRLCLEETNFLQRPSDADSPEFDVPENWMPRETSDRYSAGAVGLRIDPLVRNFALYLFVETNRPGQALPARLEYDYADQLQPCTLERANLFNQFAFLNAYQKVLFLAVCVGFILVIYAALARLRRREAASSGENDRV
ncbi:hypothetical protein [Maricaulis sp.]|uniref:hypothetical protein n=1 Tax=Maricaulis sp. TaxID=1486257 RepID=UPI0025BB24A0|nr:hypothetical protein [Maricaulis sp.]